MISVPGRICLVGEHNDWAGGSALVVPLDRYVRVRARTSPVRSATAVLEGRALSWTEGEAPGALQFVPAVANVCADAWGVPVVAAVHIEGELPAGRGFSSSAAVCVALAQAFAELAGRTLAPGDAAELAYQAERVGCGIEVGRMDPLACAWGLPLFLRFAGDEVGVEPLPAHLALAVGSFRAPRDTPGILAALGRHWRGEVAVRDWEGVRRVGAVRGAIDGFGAQARIGRDALLEGDLKELGSAMDVCQDIYEEELEPAFPELRAPGLAAAVRALRNAGALGAKFSGAGGEGSVVGLFRPDDSAGLDAGVRALDARGLDAFGVQLFCSV